MKKFYLAALAVLFMCLTSWAQNKGVVKGSLQDSLSAQPLTDATISVMRIKDSSLISFTLSDKSGRFEIKNLENGSYNLVVSYSGYQTRARHFELSNEKPWAEISLKMDRVYKALDEVIVTDQVPIQVKGDTLSFKADMFKTKPDATVEDLLKKLPGVTVDKDGTVNSQGEQIQKIYVDGKEFFSNDPKLATKNLTADMIDKVEVFDDMSEKAKFNGIDDGSRTKAINLKIKKDKKKGIFGKAYAGYGTGDHYDAGLNTNIFNNTRQVSVIAKANNANNISFSSNDMVGGGAKKGSAGLNLGGTGSGLTSSSQAGFNYRDTWNSHFEVNGSYFYNHVQTENARKRLRQTFGTDTTYLNDDQARSENFNNNQRFNLNMIYTIDSLNSIIYNPNVSFQNSGSNSNDTTSYYYTTDSLRQQTNESRSVTNNTGNGNNWSNDLTWRRKFRRTGRTLSVSFSNTLSSSERETYSNIQAKINSRNYHSNTESNTNNYGVSVSYTEPVGNGKVVELNYGYNKNRSESDKETYNFNNATSKYDLINDSLTNHFQNLNESNRAGANYRVVKSKYNYQLGLSAQETLLQSNNLSKGRFQSQNFINLFPTALFNYQFARTKNLRFAYHGRTSQPSISQLQDVLEVGNYPYLSKGNPELRQEFSNNFSLNYNFFNTTNFRNIFISFNYNNTYNRIVNSVTINRDGTQLTMPVNMNGSYSMNGNINFGLPIQKMQGGSFNTNTRVSYSHDPGLYNNIANFTSNLNVGEDLRLNYNYKEKLDAGLKASVNYNSVHYTTQANRNQAYYTHTYSADVTYVLPKNFILASDFDYTFNTGRTDGFNQNYAMWNASFARQLFKNKKGELKVSVFDILNQNVSVTRNIGQNYIEDVQNSVLQRFFMLTFTYRMNRMGGWGKRSGSPMERPGERGMFRGGGRGL